MGYYTEYTLTVQGPPRPSINEIIEDLRTSNESAAYALRDDGSCGESARWYDYISDMKEFSLKYPVHVFIVDGLGEDGERYRAYFKNGKSQEVAVRIVYEDFDHDKLK